MMRFRLRTLMIVLALGPPVLALGFSQWWAYLERRAIAESQIQQVAKKRASLKAFLNSYLSKPCRRTALSMFRFTTRDVLWLTGMGCGRLGKTG
jgi:hypothetical protein